MVSKQRTDEYIYVWRKSCESYLVQVASVCDYACSRLFSFSYRHSQASGPQNVEIIFNLELGAIIGR